MEQIVVKKEPVDDSEGDISKNYADQEMHSISGVDIKTEQVYIKQEIKEELNDDERSDESHNSDDGDESEDFSCNIKEEGSYSDLSEDDKNSSHNEKYEDEAMFEMKTEEESHRVKYDDELGNDSEVVNKEIMAKIVLPKAGKESLEEQCLKLQGKDAQKKLFKCGICLKEYQTKGGLYGHKKYIHKKDQQQVFKCGQCEYQTANKSRLNNHLKIHDKKNFLKCHFCQYTSARLHTLNAHLLSKHKIENNEKNKIKIKSKITSKIHECTKCSYSTVRKSNYDNHIKVCLKLKNVKWFECKICHHKTIDKSNLYTHEKIHNKIKKLKCFFCKYQSHIKQNLDNHILTKHLESLNESNKNLITSKTHCCQHCNYKTTRTSGLKAHLNQNH